MLIGESDAQEFVGELVEVQIPAKMALFDGDLGCTRDDAHPLLLVFDDVVADWTGAVIHLDGGRLNDAAARLLIVPSEPGVHQGPNPGLATGRLDGWGDHEIDEALGGGLQDLDLQLFLRLEVREKAALGKADRRREPTDRQLLETDRAGEVDRLVQNRLLGLLALRDHVPKIARPFVPSRKKMQDFEIEVVLLSLE